MIEPCDSIEPLQEIIGRLRKLKHDKNFLAKIFERRDREIWPRDMLVAYTPPKKKGGRPRAVGILRRSFMFDKDKGCKSLTIDFVWVMPELRSCGCGRQLMAVGILCGKPKDVHLQVAGSEENVRAVALYSSLGFVWDPDAPKHTEMILSADQAVDAAAKASARKPKATATPQPPSLVLTRVSVGAGGHVALRLHAHPVAPAAAPVSATPSEEDVVAATTNKESGHRQASAPVRKAEGGSLPVPRKTGKLGG